MESLAVVRSRVFVLVFAATASALNAHAGEPTAEQIKLFQQLPAEQQKALLEKVAGQPSASSALAPSASTQTAPPIAQPVPVREPNIRRGSWREFDTRRLALEDPELEACLRRYDVEDLREVRAVSQLAGAGSVGPQMLSWDMRRRLGFSDALAFNTEAAASARPQDLDPAGVSRVEKLWSDLLRCVDLYGRYDRDGGALKPFGYEIFSGASTSFAPTVDIPVPGDYRIGPGDTVDVLLFGKENAQYRFTVSRDGQIRFPNIGPVTVAGMTFEQLSSAIEQRVSQQMIGVRASVTMGPLRSIQVFVLGEVPRPGAYTVSGLATVTHALFASGGVDLIGSLRSIELKRGGKTVRTLDLYDLLLRGDTSDDLRLQSGDAVFIPPLGATVAVAGEVRRPAIYELKGSDTVGTALELAGGILPTAYPKATRLERIGADRTRSVHDIDATTEQGRGEKLRTGDYLHVHSMVERMETFVRLSGHVLRPGVYQWHQGMRLSDAIAGPQELQAKPDLGYLLIRREVGLERKVDVLAASLADAWAAEGGAGDPLLEPRDQLIVFGLETDRQPLIAQLVDELAGQAGAGQSMRRVTVGGLVRAPGDYPMHEGMTVGDLLRASGGLREEAYALDAELTRYEVEGGQQRRARHIKVDLAALAAGQAAADLPLAPYDVVAVKPISQWGEAESIMLRGEVKFPGLYTIMRGETLRSVIERAGGLTDAAFAGGSVFTRLDLKRREQLQLDRLATRLEFELKTLALQQAQTDPRAAEALTVGQAVVAESKAVEAVGRLVIDLEAILAGQVDLEARSGDVLTVPRITEEVTVIGEVQYATSHMYRAGTDQEDYVRQSGGATVKADDDAIYVVRANGLVDVGSAARRIKPGDTIVVPLDTERMRPLAFWSTVTQIMYQISLTVAAAQSVGVL
jgi:polysaccharide export outer membrane protein